MKAFRYEQIYNFNCTQSNSLFRAKILYSLVTIVQILIKRCEFLIKREALKAESA